MRRFAEILQSRRLRHLRLGLFPFPQRMNDETKHRDENARVRDVEGRSGMGERDVQIEEREIDHVTVKEPVGQVAHDSAEQKS